MKNVITVLIVIQFLNSNGQTPQFAWGKRVGGSHVIDIQSIASDPVGNIYQFGHYSQTVDIDPGPGINLFSSLNFAELYLCKFDSSGNFVWAKSFDGTAFKWTGDLIYSPNGSLYVGGFFTQGVIDLDPGPGTFSLNAGSNTISFLVHLDVNGNFLWAKTFGSPGDIATYDLATDASGNIYLGGIATGGVDFDPGPGTYTVLPSFNNALFFLKLDAAGNLVWVKSVATNLGFAITNALAVDGIGNVYITGAFQANLDFDPGPGVHTISSTTSPSVSSALWDIFILKLDVSGNFQWVNTYGNGQKAFGKALKADTHNNICVIGGFTGTLDIDASSATQTIASAPNSSLFQLKLNGNGSLIWGRATGGHLFNLNEGKNFDVDRENCLYITGYFLGVTNLDPGFSNFTVNTPTPGFQAFVAKYDSMGRFQWGGAMGGNGQDRGSAVNIGPDGCVYIGGVITSSIADIDPGTGIYNVSNDTSSASFFVTKLKQLCADTLDIIGSNSMYCEHEKVILTAKGPGNFNWYAVPGATSVSATGTIYIPGFLPSGIYTYTLDNNGLNCLRPLSLNTFTVDACTSLSSIEKYDLGIHVSPNPSNGLYVIHSPKSIELKLAVITNIFGVELFAINLENENTLLNLENYASGVYFLNVKGSDKVIKILLN